MLTAHASFSLDCQNSQCKWLSFVDTLAEMKKFWNKLSVAR